MARRYNDAAAILRGLQLLAKALLPYELRQQAKHCRVCTRRQQCTESDGIRKIENLQRVTDSLRPSAVSDSLDRASMVALGFWTWANLLRDGVFPGTGGKYVRDLERFSGQKSDTAAQNTAANATNLEQSTTVELTVENTASSGFESAILKTIVGDAKNVQSEMEKLGSLKPEQYASELGQVCDAQIAQKETTKDTSESVNELKSSKFEDLSSELAGDAEPMPKKREERTQWVTESKMKQASQKQELNPASKSRKVPVSRIGRVASFGNLAFGLSMGALAEVTKRGLGLSKSGKDEAPDSILGDQNPFLTEANAERIVNTLCRVRGAALKLGQMLSIQDNSLISPQLQRIFERVRYSADFMPSKQIYRILQKELGSQWRSLFLEFDDRPFAAASIGQVHRAVLPDHREVCVKIQYPGVGRSIDSDVDNLVTILNLGNIFPKGLYLDKFVTVARKELRYECDYLREAKAAKYMRELLTGDSNFYVPKVIDDLTTTNVLTSELIYGQSLDKCTGLSQADRDWVGEKILALSLRELFEFRFMQTDPNWSNFFYADSEMGRRVFLLDFGASRSYGREFVEAYMKIIKSAYDQNREGILRFSRDIGFLTGYESKVMEDAHCDAVQILGEAFASEEPFSFGQQNIIERISKLVPVMTHHRLTPPPEEIYSLHRKLSGAFLLCAKLGSRVPCKPIFDGVYRRFTEMIAKGSGSDESDDDWLK